MAKITGGEKASQYLADLIKKLGKPTSLQVGFFENSTYPDGKSVPMIAAFNEFGTRNMPPRPFFRNMVHDKSHEWGPAAANLLKTNDVETTLNLMGEGIKGQLQQSINDLWIPPLAESTIERKGFDKPLIDTSVMINSVGYRVKS